MVTADIIRRSFEAIISKHKARLHFRSVWTNVLDEADQCFPAVWWGPLSGAITPVEGIAPVDTFNVDMLFVDQTASDRQPDERDGAHDRMDAVARQVWRRFANLYVLNSSTFDGVEMDLALDAAPVLQPVYDDGAKHVTGVRLTVTLVATSADSCMDQYFDP